MQNEKPTEANEIILLCNYTNIDNGLLSKKWFKNDYYEIVDGEDENIKTNENQLQFTYLNHSIHNGRYKCQIELINGQVFESDNINMTVYC